MHTVKTPFRYGAGSRSLATICRSLASRGSDLFDPVPSWDHVQALALSVDHVGLITSQLFRNLGWGKVGTTLTLSGIVSSPFVLSRFDVHSNFASHLRSAIHSIGPRASSMPTSRSYIMSHRLACSLVALSSPSCNGRRERTD
jgi:hypothetical protein